MLKLILAGLLALLPLAADAAPTRFTVTVEGSGPDLILIPGLMSHRAVWDPTVAELGGRYRVHRVQIAGFAGEPAGRNGEGPLLAPIVEELNAYIAAEGLRRPSIIGHSMGGLIGLMLADAHPQSVGALMIVDALPFYPLLFSPDATTESVAPQAARLRDAITAMDAAAWAAQQRSGVAALVAREDGRETVLGWSLASDRGVAAQAIYEVMTTDMRSRLPGIAVPLTIVYAVNAFAPEERYGALVRRAYAAAPQVRFEAAPDSRHFLMLDQPDRFAAILDRFLADASR